MENNIKKAAELITNSKYCIAFTGAGVSVESGIPPFRGETGIWNKYDPNLLEISYFKVHPEESWKAIREIFYEFMGKAEPNKAHKVLADLEKQGILKAIVTQNIDNLHQSAGSMKVFEFHGNAKRMICLKCPYSQDVTETDLSKIPVLCPKCNGLMKPDFIFFGEGIPKIAYNGSITAARNADVCLIIGSTGEVMPAAMIPFEAKNAGAKIIEINPDKSQFTDQITDIWLKGKAGEIFEKLEREISFQ